MSDTTQSVKSSQCGITADTKASDDQKDEIEEAPELCSIFRIGAADTYRDESPPNVIAELQAPSLCNDFDGA